MDAYDRCHKDIEEQLNTGKITVEQARQYHGEIESEREDMAEHMIKSL